MARARWLDEAKAEIQADRIAHRKKWAKIFKLRRKRAWLRKHRFWNGQFWQWRE